MTAFALLPATPVYLELSGWQLQPATHRVRVNAHYFSNFRSGHSAFPQTMSLAALFLQYLSLTWSNRSVFACASNKGICLLEFTDRRMLETEFRDLCKRLNAVNGTKLSP